MITGYGLFVNQKLRTKKNKLTRKQFADIFGISQVVVDSWLAPESAGYYREPTKIQTIAIEAIIGQAE